ncbi:AraC family transcriptional regulator [Paenibacillus ginsengarvi]|uniref:AraC family transcriptional regulator n=2 Tax=Paenibacillus ginsengarvi TaxID=400777 RepID=A0A3B0CGY2_9BACL|nr:AraC family transcriptional regulator [Paenibacillus ginsengarvi]
MKIMNYLNLNHHPVHLSFVKDRTLEFNEIYHAHQGIELLYVHEGSGQVIVNQRIFELSPGSLVYFRPFQLHRVQMKLESQSPYVRSLFVFEPSELGRYLAPFHSLRTFFQRLWQVPLESQLFVGLPRLTLDNLFEEHRERMLKMPDDLLLEEQMLFLIALLQILKAHEEPGPQTTPPPIRKSSVSERVMKWVEEHYAEPFELERVASDIHLTPTHISAVFRQTVGTSITEYLTARRIREACWLLKTTDRSVQEIGQAIGLTNFSYFCNLFKKHVGLSPYKYKHAPAGSLMTIE